MAAEEPLQGIDDDLLKGWKDIARFLHSSERTVQRWEHTLRLPVRRAGTPSASLIYATRTELRTWLQSTEGATAVADPSDADRSPAADSSDTGPLSDPVDAVHASRESAGEAPVRVSRRLPWLGLAVVALALTGVVYRYAGSAWWGKAASATPQATTAVGGQASQASPSAVMLLRLTLADGTWSVVGIPYGAAAMSTRVGGVSLVFTAVRVGDESQVHVSPVKPGLPGNSQSLGEAVVITLRQDGSATPTGVPGLAKIEWLLANDLQLPKPPQLK